MRMRLKTRGAGAFTKFRLLMWKNFVQQWRHPLQTALELMLPVLTLSIVLVIRWLVEPSQREAVTFPPVPVQTLTYSIPILSVLNLTRMSIAYSPRNDVLEDVVRSAVADVILWNANDFINNPDMNHTEIIDKLFPDLNITDIDQWPGWNITDLIDQLPGLNITDLIDQLPGLNITDIIDLLPGNITEIMEQFPGLNITDIINQLPGLNITDIIEQLPGLNITDNPAVYEIIKSLIPVQAYDTSQELRGIYEREESTREVLTGVEFEDALFGATELPNNISYALRFPQRPRLGDLLAIGSRSWRTDVVFPAFESPGPRFPWSPSGGTDPAYVNEMFIALQHGISTQLLSRITGEPANSFEVNLQRFPHPAYLEDFGAEALESILPMFVMISFSYTAVNIVRAITVEKEKQLKETLKIMGMPTWINWTSWFCKQFIYLAVAAVLITVLLKVQWFTNEDGFSDYAVFTNTPWTVLIFFILLYLTCTIFFCFMLSGFFSKGSTAALFTGVLWFLTYTPAFLLSIDISMSVSVQMLSCLSLNSAMAYGFQLLVSRENIGGMHWGDFMISPSTNSSRLLFGHVIIMLCVNCVLYMLVALYLEQVLPGPFGAPKPWYFLFQRNFWRSGKVSGLEVQRLPETPQVTKEREPINHSIGVKMTNLTKIYGENIAVKKLSMNIYDDQITVLLGHNGAGKSTTISMLTGNLEASSGSMYVAGYDMAWDTAAARAHIGLCPQHNVLFDDLTVREHLEFFSKLKGFEGAELKNEIEILVTKLELQEKLNCQSKGLSGGQKRRLCVGIALCGDARVVLLDEPTSGMDPSSRRALWDLLQKEKKGRCMILTTHFMDEADILGDRIAIMSSGKLQCIGSPYFLKQHYGIGYTLVIVKNDGFQLEECTELLTKYIPNITVKEDRGTEVSYSMTNEHSQIFETMLNDLENHMEIIKFKNYGLVATTLEDVFMSIGSDIETSNSEYDYSTTTSETMSDVLTKKYDFDATSMDSLDESKPIRGYRLLLQHMLAVWLKLYLVWSRTWVVKLLQLLVPVLILVSTLGILEYVMSLRSSLYRRPLTLEEGYTSTETLLNFAGNYSTSRGALALNAYQVMFNSSGIPTMTYSIIDEPLDEFYTRKTYEPVDMSHARHRWLTGATFTDAGATAWFSNFAHHDIATSLAAVHSALLKATHPEADIRVFNYPLEVQYQDQRDLQSLLAVLSMQLSSGIGSSLSIACAAFIMFYIKERVSRAKLLQKASGIQPIVLWTSAAVFDWIWFLFIALSVIISIAVFSLIGMSTVEDLGRLYLLLIIYGAAMLPLVYLASHGFNGPAMGFVVLFFMNVLLGSLAAQVVDILFTPSFNAVQVAEVLDMLLQFFPLYSLIASSRSLHNISLVKESCLSVCDHLVAVIGLDHCDLALMCERIPNVCCVPENAYFDWEKPGVLRYITAMLVSCLVLWTIFMAIEYNVIQRFFKRKQIPPPALEDDVDTDVLDEARHAEATNLSGHSLVARKLSKYYGKNLAVNQISFSVSEGECFGLLGVNGAGKTSTFKMLMGDETVSSGDAFVGGHSVRTDITKVHENIGYCPQFDAVFEELTGRETLRLFSLLRGLSVTHAAARSAALAHALGFTKHLDKRVSQYSGGNKRKLSTAVALLGHTRMVFVDEPTTGVDPAAKRQVWRAIRSAQRAGRGIVLTSHSMEECEALCSRLTIMVNGLFQCLGTPQHLKNKYSEGFTLTIKMKVEEEQPSTSSCSVLLPVDTVKAYVEANFVTPKLMEEYQGLLTYYLPDKSTVWSRMFGIMERAKQDLPIEDYSISQTTLEQIFLQFTKYQRKTKPIE